MTKKNIIWTVIAIVFIILVVRAINSSNSAKNVATTEEQTAQTITIGAILPLSGPAGNMGEEVANALKLASTTSVKLVFEDDQCDAKKALSAYEKLSLEKVRVYYVACSGSVLALAPRLKQDGNLLLTAYAGSSEIRKTGDEVIRFIPDAISIAEAMAGYVSSTTPNAKIGLLHENQDYAKSTALTIQEILGKKISEVESYSAEDLSFRTQISKLKSNKIEVLLYIPTSDKAAKLVYKEMQTLGFKPQMIGDVNACEYPFSSKDFGIEMTCFDAGFPIETQAYKDFLALYKKTYGTDSNAAFYDASTFDVMTLVDRFMKTAKADSGVGTADDIVTALKKYFLAGVDGVMTRYDFTPNGEVKSEGSIKKVVK